LEESVDDEGPVQDEADTEDTKGNPEMWKAVERAMKEGTLDALRNRASTATTSRVKDDERPERKIRNKPKKVSNSGVMAQMAKETKAAFRNAEEDENESDGGFFE
jgi:hypothetical protein